MIFTFTSIVIVTFESGVSTPPMCWNLPDLAMKEFENMSSNTCPKLPESGRCLCGPKTNYSRHARLILLGILEHLLCARADVPYRTPEEAFRRESQSQRLKI